MKNLSLISLSIVVLIMSCSSPEKTMLSGNYDSAIDKSVRKLRSNKHSKKADEYVLVLEDAFTKARERDNKSIDYLETEGRPENHVKIYQTYERMKRRQDKIRPLLPLYVNSENREVQFNFIDYTTKIISSKRKATEYLYNHGVELLAKDDRLSARAAYKEFSSVKRIISDYQDVDAQIKKSKLKGTTKAVYMVINQSGTPMPKDIHDNLMKVDLKKYNKTWLAYYTKYDTSVFYDYSIIVRIKSISIGPNSVKEKEFKEERELKEGFEYVLDKSGNVMKDSIGNDIKRDKYVFYEATVTEKIKTKSANITGVLEYLNNKTGDKIKEIPLTVDGGFENITVSYSGSSKALKAETKAKLKNPSLPYPSNQEVVRLAGLQIRPIVERHLEENRTLVRE